MKFLQNFIDKLEPSFEHGGKYEKFYPAFEALQSFLFSTKKVTPKGTHIRDSLDTKRYMSIVLFSLKPALLFGIYNAGYQAHKASGMSLDMMSVMITGLKYVIPLILVSYGVGLFWEFLFSVVRGHEVNEGFLVTGLLYPLILPPTLPLWQAAVGITFGVIIAKEVFGGTGRNFLNPALTARAFLFFAYPAQISGDNVWTAVSKPDAIDGFSGATALSVAVSTPGGASVTGALNDAGFTLSNLFWGFVPGSIGETSVVCALLGAGILIVTGVGSWRTMLSCVLGVVCMGTVFNLVAGPSSLAFFELPIMYHLCMGGFAFGAVFMATDPVSSPTLETSKWIYGFLIGILVVIIRIINPAYPEGVMLAILLMNVFAPLIDHIVLQKHIKKRIANVI
jgi:Na+-transporting NADH:ubiquinone oxidoreductase subunit B